MQDIWFALWFFLPAGMANVAPIFAAQLPIIKAWDAPMDMGRSWRHKRILGDHKTWRGLISGMIVGILFVGLESYLYSNNSWARTASAPLDYMQVSIVGLGLALSVGALGGDALKSFFKRQFNVSSGHSWFPFDQLDYIIGALLLSSLIVRLPAAKYAWIVILWFGLHLIFSYLGYLVKLKEHPI